MSDRSLSWGVGIEVGTATMRVAAVRLDRPADPVAAHFAVQLDDDDAVLDALVLASGTADVDRPTRLPVHIAVADDALLMQTVDVTGWRRDRVVALGERAARLQASDASLMVEDGVRRRVGLVRGIAGPSGRLADLAARAGFARVRIEPAPLALGRVLPDGRVLVRRAADEAVSWFAVFEDGFPLAAAATPSGLVEWPALSEAPAGGRHDDPDDLLGPEQLVDHLDRVVARSLARTGSHHPADGHDPVDADGWPAPPPQITVASTTHPSYPRHDPRSADRIAVALGAAIGAAGATERHRRLLELAPLRPSTPPGDTPWALEPVAAGPRHRRSAPATPASVSGISPRTHSPDRGRRATRRYRRRR